MSKVDDGGPAFPQHVAISPSGDVYGSSYYGDRPTPKQSEVSDG
jgi:hypothetical protein